MSYITAIGTATPTNKISQSVIADFMVPAMKLNDSGSRKLRAIFRASGIDFRHSVLADYGKQKDFSFYSNTPGFEPFPSTQKRMEVFRTTALPLSVAAITNALRQLPGLNVSELTHLIVVCCTGMYAPGLDIDIVKSLNLPSTINRTCITFMGCYAAFNALKIADVICKVDSAAKVLIVCTELCSLHFQRETTDDNLLANALFSDGSAALIMEGVPGNNKASLRTMSFYNDLAIEGEHDMAWKIGDLGFEMKLSSYVPDIIRRGIKQLTNSLLVNLKKTLPDVKFFAIHPGGKKILEAIEQELDLSKQQNADAYHVMRHYGNMSSPTVLFVLKEIFSKVKAEDDGAYILSFAFGPGLTLESGLFQIYYNSYGKNVQS